MVVLFDLVVEVEKEVTIEDINNAVKKASENELKGILDYSDIPLVFYRYSQESSFKYL